MSVFDFLTDLAPYNDNAHGVERLERRHRFLIDDFKDEIIGARVLDLGAHDGRWSYAFAAAGAASVTGIEVRPDTAARFTEFPDDAARVKVAMRIDDVFIGLEKALAAGERYDIIAVFGLLYHVMDHFRLLTLIRALGPSLVIIDGDFVKRAGAVITLRSEKTDNCLNAAPYSSGKPLALKGIPSQKALKVMADALEYQFTWSDWTRLAPEDRFGVRDYYPRDDRKYLRATCALRP